MAIGEYSPIFSDRDGKVTSGPESKVYQKLLGPLYEKYVNPDGTFKLTASTSFERVRRDLEEHLGREVSYFEGAILRDPSRAAPAERFLSDIHQAIMQKQRELWPNGMNLGLSLNPKIGFGDGLGKDTVKRFPLSPEEKEMEIEEGKYQAALKKELEAAIDGDKIILDRIKDEKLKNLFFLIRDSADPTHKSDIVSFAEIDRYGNDLSYQLQERFAFGANFNWGGNRDGLNDLYSKASQLSLLNGIVGIIKERP